MSRSPCHAIVHGPLNIHLPAWRVNPNLHRSTFMLICCKHFMFKSVYTLFPDVVMAATNLLSLSNRSLALPNVTTPSWVLFERVSHKKLVISISTYFPLHLHLNFHNLSHKMDVSQSLFLISCKSHTSINVLVLKPEPCTVHNGVKVWYEWLNQIRVEWLRRHLFPTRVQQQFPLPSYFLIAQRIILRASRIGHGWFSLSPAGGVPAAGMVTSTIITLLVL